MLTFSLLVSVVLALFRILAHCIDKPQISRILPLLNTRRYRAPSLWDVDLLSVLCLRLDRCDLSLVPSLGSLLTLLQP